MMRDLIRVFYYPDYIMPLLTLKKAILFFDEIHVMDRPSFEVTEVFGTVGCASPLRSLAAWLNEHCLPFQVHEARSGYASDGVYRSMANELGDVEFLRLYQQGLRESALFRDMQVSPGNYGENVTHVEVAKRLATVDLRSTLSAYQNPSEILNDNDVEWFDTSTPAAQAKYLVAMAATTSLKMGYALEHCSQEGFIPFADSAPFSWFLGRQYVRAVDRLSKPGREIQLTDLSFAVFDGLADTERLNKLSIAEVCQLRKRSNAPRDAFLEYLAALQVKQAAIGPGEDYEIAVRNIIETEVFPAARSYKERVANIMDEMYGTLAKGAIAAIGSGSIVKLLGDLSLQNVVAAVGIGASVAGAAAVDAIVRNRAARRECVISYVLQLS